MAPMNTPALSIHPVRIRDLPRLTQMAYANMMGVDVEFTRFARHPLARLFHLPLYLLTAGQGYKAVIQGEIVGCAYLHMGKFSGTAFNVHVNAPYRRQGIGRALMLHVEQQVRRAGLRWIALQVDRDNHPAQQLYENLDYRPYHPTYLRSGPTLTLLPPRREQVALGALSHRHGRSLFQKYADMERNQGDAWAATVVKHDFGELPPPGGLFWRCLHGSEEIGCAWQSERGSSASVILLLKNTYWNQPMVTLGLLRLLQTQRGSHPRFLSVHFGSSSHYEAAAPSLQELGFEPTRRAQILMLKKVSIRDEQ